MAKDFDDFEEYAEPAILGVASGCGQYFSNPIGFGKDIPAPFRLPLKVVYDARGKDIDIRLYTTVNGTTYQLQPISKKAAIHFASNLFDILGAKHYEQD